MSSARFDRYRQLLKDRTFPLAYVDLELFDQNVRELVARAQGKPIRLASKSVRCVELIHRALRHPGFQGVMAYRGYEAVKLAQEGITDILLGYPLADPAEIAAVIENNVGDRKIVLMTDRPEHLEQAHALARSAGRVVPVCIDLDVSTRFLGKHYGVNRSWIRSDQRLEQYLKTLTACPNVKLVAAMGYEAQVAGIPDVSSKFRWMKRFAVPELNVRRARWVKRIEAAVGKLDYVNGGGTGSFEGTLQDPSVTELTSGSGLFSPALFDHYQQFRHQPAAGFVLQVVRKAEDDQVTCFGGGYIASGGINPLKVPTPVHPPGLTLFDREGCGEVQTPLSGPSARTMNIGDLVFFRYAKAGEMNERFNELLLISGNDPVKTVSTYRGTGWNFG